LNNTAAAASSKAAATAKTAAAATGTSAVTTKDYILTATTGAPRGTPYAANVVVLDDQQTIDQLRLTQDHILLAVYEGMRHFTHHWSFFGNFSPALLFAYGVTVGGKWEDVDVPAPEPLDAPTGQ
jgi:hypothetical protein